MRKAKDLTHIHSKEQLHFTMWQNKEIQRDKMKERVKVYIDFLFIALCFLWFCWFVWQILGVIE